MKNTQTLAPSIWEKGINWTKRTGQSTQNRTLDIIIVGSGLVGLWLAYHLKTMNRKLNILIVEKGLIPTGASTRNAGFACFGSVMELVSNLKSMDKSEFWNMVGMRINGIAMTRKLVGDRNIDYDPCGGYECLFDPNLSDINDQINMLNRNLCQLTDMYPVFKISDKDKMSKFGFSGFTGMIENELEGSLNSGKLIRALIQKVREMNVDICNGFEVKNFAKKRNFVHVQSTNSTSFTAKHVILCTNGFTNNLIPKEYGITPARGQIILTSPIPNLPFYGTFHCDEGFYYFRNLGDRVLLGGARNKAIEEETTITMETSVKIQTELERFLKEHILPGRKDYSITDRWSGIMGFTDSHLPIMHTYNNLHVVCACNGMGVAIAPSFTKTVANRLKDELA